MFNFQERVLFRLFGCVCIVLLSLLVVTADGYSAEPKVIELKVAHGSPPNSTWDLIFQEWGKKLQQETGGRVRVTIYPGGAIANHRNAIESTSRGLCDVAYAPFDQWGVPHLDTIVNQQFMGWPNNAEAATNLLYELHKRIPAMETGYKQANVKLLWMIAPRNMALHFTKRVVRVPADVKGVKITTASPRALLALGASPVSLPPTEVYSGLDRGVCEGTFGAWSFLNAYKVLPLVPYHTNLDMGSDAAAAVMSVDKFNSLPPDIQKIIENLNPWARKMGVGIRQKEDDAGIEAARKLGHTFTEPTKSEQQLWHDGAKPAYEEWIAKMEEKKLPGRLVFETALKLIGEYSK